MIKLIEKLSKNVVMALFTLIIGILTITSLITTCYLNDNEHTYYTFESAFSFLALAGILFLLFLLFKKYRTLLAEKLNIRSILLAALCLGIFYVMISQVHPKADQKVCLAIAEQMHDGNYEAFQKGGYMQVYPQQAGIVLVYYLLGFLFGPHNVVALQIINVIAYVWFIYAIYRITKHMFASEAVALSSAILCLLFLPLLIYTSFLYGTMLGLAASTYSFFKAMEYMQTRKPSDGLFCALLIGFAVLVKKNYLIVVVALLLVLLLHTIIKRHYRALLCMLLIAASYLCFTIGAKTATEKLTGIPIGDGLPSIAWVTMGLQDGSRASGWYNRYSLTLYQDHGCDSAATAAAAKEELINRLHTFAKNPGYAAAFFAQKTASQWSEPSFGSFFILHNPVMNMEESPLLTKLVDGPMNLLLLEYLDLLQSVIYMGILFFAIYQWKHLRIWDLFPAIIFLGGFLFHTAWEAKAQYTFCYFVLLFPYCIKGYSDFFYRILALRKTSDAITPKKLLYSFAPMALCLFVCIVYTAVSYVVPPARASIKEANTIIKTKLKETPLLLNGMYRLKVPGKNKYLDFTLAQDEEFAITPLLAAKEAPSQLIKIKDNGNGVKLQLNLFQKSLSSISFEMIPDETLERRKNFYSDSSRFSWSITDHSDGTYSIKTQNGYALTRAKGGSIILKKFEKSNSKQKWELEKNEMNPPSKGAIHKQYKAAEFQ